LSAKVNVCPKCKKPLTDLGPSIDSGATRWYCFEDISWIRSDNYAMNGKNAGEFIYKIDEGKVPYGSTQTRTVIQTVSRTQITTIQTGENPLGDIISNPLAVPITIAGLAMFVFFCFVPSIFGSWIDFVDCLKRLSAHDKVSKKKKKK
jgi:hypothetical protein